MQVSSKLALSTLSSSSCPEFRTTIFRIVSCSYQDWTWELLQTAELQLLHMRGRGRTKEATVCNDRHLTPTTATTMNPAASHTWQLSALSPEQLRGSRATRHSSFRKWTITRSCWLSAAEVPPYYYGRIYLRSVVDIPSSSAPLPLAAFIRCHRPPPPNNKLFGFMVVAIRVIPPPYFPS